MQKIKIDRFRQISHAEIELRDFVFLIGPQASGKSTIAKLIYLFKTLKQDYISFFEDDGHEINQNTICQSFIKKIQDNFAIYFGKTFFLDDDFLVTYFFSVEKNYSATLSKQNGTLNIQFSDKQWVALNNESRQLIKELKRVDNNNISKVTKLNTIFYEQRRKKILSAANQIFCDERECLFLPAGRNITVSYPDQFQMLFYGELRSAVYDKKLDNSIDIQLMRDFINYSTLLKDYFLGQHLDLNYDMTSPFEKKLSANIFGILRGEYQNEGGYEKMVHENGLYTPLSKASSGQQEVIRLIQDAMYIYNESLKASRIIEEPETHLFPHAQQLLIQLLILVANKTENQIIITTHSPHVLATFNNLLYYSRVLKQSDSTIRTEIEKRFGTEGFDEGKKERLNISIDKFQAYALDPREDVYCKSIVDNTTELIGENNIDMATEDIYDDFDFLYSLIS